MENLYARIIFATDLGPQSLYIGERAVRMGRTHNAEIVAVHVLERELIQTSSFFEQEESFKRREKKSQAILNALCADLGFIFDRQLVIEGNPLDQILSLSLKYRANLIVAGSHGIGGYGHLLGSTAQGLIVSSTCDVLVVQVRHLQHDVSANTPYGEYPGEFLPKPLHAAHGRDVFLKYGSEKGFGEVTHRGPRPLIRPSFIPYKGGTRIRTSEEENEDSQKEE